MRIILCLQGAVCVFRSFKTYVETAFCLHDLLVQHVRLI